MTGHRFRTIVRTTTVAGAALVIGAALMQGSGAVAATSTAKASSTVLSYKTVQSMRSTALYPGGLATQSGTTASTRAAALKAAHRTAEASALSQIASQPVSVWLGDWYTTPQLKKAIGTALATAAKQKRTATFVTYAIPDRDCGDYSAGGLASSKYTAWNQVVATALRGTRAAVIVEPDALSMISNCPSVEKVRVPLIRSAVKQFATAGVTTYLDAGNSHWVSPTVMAARLKAAGIGYARGFSTNVSNFYLLADERAYGNKISALTGGSHFVVDVSRNGSGWKGTWCNPPGAALGINPRVGSGRTKIDALLWVKTPGASDGTCNGGPTAGTWWESYALALVKNRTAR